MADRARDLHKIKDNKLFRNAVIFLFIAAVVFWVGFCGGTGETETTEESVMRSFTLILWSILLEALPFVLLGTVISSLIQVFVSEEMILKILPKNGFMRLVFASLLGLVFPVCECAIIPITRGLIKKGMPTGAAVAFMLATPIVNPVVLFSTYNAFLVMPQMVLYRAVGGLLGAIIIGALVSRKGGEVLVKAKTQETCCHEHCSHVGSDKKRSKGEVLKEILQHTSEELKSVGMYLIFGAMIASAMQIFVTGEVIAGLGGGRIASIVVMMLLAFVLSLCSEADAFVASTFMFRFSGASVLAFLITGPMIDIKNTLMLFGSFKKRFAIRLIITILIVCFTLALAASFIMGGSYA